LCLILTVKYDLHSAQTFMDAMHKNVMFVVPVCVCHLLFHC